MGHDIIVIGASQGGVLAIPRLVSQLPADLPAAIFVVQHVSSESPAVFGELLGRAGPLPARMAVDGEAIEMGRIYVAPPDHHLLVREGKVEVTHGPHENYWRPAVDPLFRSAAISYGARVVGVILTGLLYDGAAGILAVKRCGGTAVIQDPRDAAEPEMPESALRLVKADHCISLAEIAPLITRLAHTPAAPQKPIPKEILVEDRIMETAMNDPKSGLEFGSPTSLTCPECGGALRQVEDPDLLRYRCHVGHAFTEGALLDGQTDALECTLWAALRALKERAALLSKMARDARDRGRSHSSARYEQQAAESFAHADRLQDLLQRGLSTPAETGEA